MKKRQDKLQRELLHSLNVQIYTSLKPFRLPLILIAVIFLVGTLGYVFIDNFPILDAIYQTGITFTTVGFGEMGEITQIGRIFTIILIVSGFVTFSIIIATITNIVNSGHILSLLRERAKLNSIIRLYNHYVIYYYNSYTQRVIEEFKHNHTPFVVVDPNPEFEQIAIREKLPYYIVDEPHKEETHIRTHLASAKGVIILSRNTSDNISQIVSVRLFEQELGRDPYYITSYSETKTDIDKLKKLGADEVLSPAELLAKKIGVLVLDPQKALTLSFLEEIFYKKHSEMKIEEIIIEKTSWVALKKMKETYIRDITNVSVIGITNKDNKFISMPKRDVIIGIGAKLLVMGSEDNIEKTKKLLFQIKQPKQVLKHLQGLEFKSIAR